VELEHCEFCDKKKPCDCEDCYKCDGENCVWVVVDEAHDGTPTIGYHCQKCDEMW
jgi:hypothetical protein